MESYPLLRENFAIFQDSPRHNVHNPLKQPNQRIQTVKQLMKLDIFRVNSHYMNVIERLLYLSIKSIAKSSNALDLSRHDELGTEDAQCRQNVSHIWKHGHQDLDQSV
jgi:hypothetical protein